MIRINGKDQDVCHSTLLEYLSSEGYNIKHVAVELNGSIVPRSEYESTALKNGDVMEIVSFVAGG